MANPNCPACGAAQVAGSMAVAENMYGTGEVFEYATCASCGTLVLRDVPEDLAPYYPQDYYSVGMDPEVALGRRGVRQVATVIFRSALWGRGWVSGTAHRVMRKRQLRNLIGIMTLVRQQSMLASRTSRVLDVGCGSGLLVFALGLAGQRNVVGIDPFAAEDRELSTGGSVRRRELGDEEGRYDLVMLHHSLEHVRSPERTLREAMHVLAPGGRILVRMPTPSSEAFELYGPHWAQLDPPRHLVLLTRTGVDALCARLGLEVEACVDDSTGFAYWASEQVVNGTPLLDPASAMVNPSASAFSRAQLDAWEARANAANEAARGDQAAWVLRPTAGR